MEVFTQLRNMEFYFRKEQTEINSGSKRKKYRLGVFFKKSNSCKPRFKDMKLLTRLYILQ